MSTNPMSVGTETIKYRDFAPDWKKRVLGVSVGGRQSLDSVVEQINAWVTASAIKVINVETVVLPEAAAESPGKGELDEMRYNVGMFELGPKRLQVVRVWYRA